MEATASSAQGPGGGGTGLPDLNVETYPFQTVFQLLERAASFQMLAVPGAGGLDPRAPELAISSDLHRFEAEATTAEDGLSVAQTVGEKVGSFSSRWLVTDEGWDPSRVPSGRPFDPARPQALVFQEDRVRFVNGIGFDGYGVGATRPIEVAGRRQLLVSGVGDVRRGIGKLEGISGTYFVDGVLVPGEGFRGIVFLRALDPQRRLRGEDPVPAPRAGGVASPEATYVVLHGQKRGAGQHTEWRLGPDGRPVGILTPAEMSGAIYRFRVGGALRLQCERRVRSRVGNLEATIAADLNRPPGTHERPVPFGTRNTYTFTAPGGGTLGTVDAQVEVGQSFGLAFASLPGQKGLRFAGVGPILRGTGIFEGVQGTVAVSSAIGLAPHALSLVNVLRIIDPGGRFRGGRG
jgi:hypothetical protein